jgi:hypothetical protein
MKPNTLLILSTLLPFFADKAGSLGRRRKTKRKKMTNAEKRKRRRQALELQKKNKSKKPTPSALQLSYLERINDPTLSQVERTALLMVHRNAMVENALRSGVGIPVETDPMAAAMAMDINALKEIESKRGKKFDAINIDMVNRSVAFEQGIPEWAREENAEWFLRMLPSTPGLTRHLNSPGLNHSYVLLSGVLILQPTGPISVPPVIAGSPDAIAAATEILGNGPSSRKVKDMFIVTTESLHDFTQLKAYLWLRQNRPHKISSI